MREAELTGVNAALSCLSSLFSSSSLLCFLPTSFRSVFLSAGLAAHSWSFTLSLTFLCRRFSRHLPVTASSRLEVLGFPLMLNP